jgi:hypothetical protein
LGVEVLEILCNWRGINNLRSAKQETLWPSIESLRHQGVVPCEKPTSVLLALPQRDDIDIMELRDWLDLNAKGHFKMFNRFNYDEQRYQIKRAYVGVNFRFTDPKEACLFKLFWT